MLTQDSIEKIKLRAEGLFVEFGFNSCVVRGEKALERKGKYRKFTFIRSFESFVIEYAESFEDALKNLYEDGDLYPISLGEDKLISALREDIPKYYLD